MKMEDHFKDTLNKAVANEPPVRDAWSTFERRVSRRRWMRWSAGLATAAALAVAAVFIIPKIARDNPVIVNPVTRPPTSTFQLFANWKTATSATMLYRLRYPEDWAPPATFEGVDSLQPPNVEPLEKGAPTFAVTIAFHQGEKYAPPAGSDPGVDRPDGRRNYREVPIDGPGETFVIEWSACAAGVDPCEEVSGTLVVRVIAGSEDLWRRYSLEGTNIAAKIEHIEPETPSPTPIP